MVPSSLRRDFKGIRGVSWSPRGFQGYEEVSGAFKMDSRSYQGLGCFGVSQGGPRGFLGSLRVSSGDLRGVSEVLQLCFRGSQGSSRVSGAFMGIPVSS